MITEDTKEEMGSNPFAMFETDSELELKGVLISYPGYWFRVRRPGGVKLGVFRG